MSNAAAQILEARDEPVRRGVSSVPRPLSRMTLCRAGLGGAALRSRSDRGHIRARISPPIEPAVGHAIAIHIAMAPMVKDGVRKWHCDDQGPRASGFMSQPGGRRPRMLARRHKCHLNRRARACHATSGFTTRAGGT